MPVGNGDGDCDVGTTICFLCNGVLHPMKPEDVRGLHHPGGLDSADKKARTCSQFSAAPLGLRASISSRSPHLQIESANRSCFTNRRKSVRKMDAYPYVRPWTGIPC